MALSLAVGMHAARPVSLSRPARSVGRASSHSGARKAAQKTLCAAGKNEALAAEVVSNDAKYMVKTYSKPPIVFTHGQGCTLYDTEGKEYLDFTAGIAVNVLGHSDQGWQDALREQAGKLCHVSNLFLSEPGPALARLLVENSFADRTFFANSGTEANEAAIKFARKYQRVKFEGAKSKLRMPWAKPASSFIAFADGFHGRTMGALALTWKEGYRKPFEPLMPGVQFAAYGDLEAVRRMAKKGKTAAIFVEPVQGEGGCRPAQADFLRGLRALCDEIGALLVFDEVQCGLGRTGHLWAHQAVGVTPDIMTVAKPLAAGLPIGALLCTQAVADVMQPGDHGSTFAGGPLICEAARYVVDRVRQPEFLAGVTARGEQLVTGLREALAGSPHVKEVRGSGLLVGIQLDIMATPIVEACRAKGLLIITAGKGDVVRLVPPLTVSAAEVEQAIALLKEVIMALPA